MADSRAIPTKRVRVLFLFLMFLSVPTFGLSGLLTPLGIRGSQLGHQDARENANRGFIRLHQVGVFTMSPYRPTGAGIAVFVRDRYRVVWLCDQSIAVPADVKGLGHDCSPSVT